MRKVSLVKGDDRRKNIKDALDLIKDDLEIVIKKAKNILIKPNLTAVKGYEIANIDVAVIDELIKFINFNFGLKNIVISEGSGSAFYSQTSTEQVFKDYGYFNLSKKYNNVKIEFIEQYSDFFKIPIKTCHDDWFVEVAERVKNFDVKISVGIPKMHNYAIATFGIKNMMGMLKPECMSRIHGLKNFDENGPSVFNKIPTSIISRMRRIFPVFTNWLVSATSEYKKGVRIIHDNIFNVIKEIYPDVVLLDGYYCMEGNGPVDGIGVKMNFAVASTDALKADALAARCIGLDPDYIPYLKKFNGYGDSSISGLVGERLENVIKPLKKHSSYKIQKKYCGALKLIRT